MLNPSEEKSSRVFNAKADLCLHTKLAQSFFDKTWVPGKVGLVQFADQTKKIYHAYKLDDPYAHWVLLNTYKKLYEAIQQTQEMSNQLQSYFDNLRGIKLRAFQDETDWRRPLGFAVFCPYLGAELLGNVDYVLSQLDTLRQFGMMQTKKQINKKEVIHLMQQVFSYPMKWRHTGVTRQDIRDNNQNAQRAKQIFSDLEEMPSEVFEKKIEFSFLPKI